MTKCTAFIIAIGLCCLSLIGSVGPAAKAADGPGLEQQNQAPKLPPPRHRRDIQIDKVELTPQPIFYPDKKSILADPEQLDILREDAGKMKKYPEAKFLVAAYTDKQGKEQDNMVLTIKISEFICAKLISFGVAPEALGCAGQGQTDRYCKEQTEDCYKLNRRVTISMMND